VNDLIDRVSFDVDPCKPGVVHSARAIVAARKLVGEMCDSLPAIEIHCRQTEMLLLRRNAESEEGLFTDCSSRA
jgi:hypothetical protein